MLILSVVTKKIDGKVLRVLVQEILLFVTAVQIETRQLAARDIGQTTCSKQDQVQVDTG